MKLLHVLSFVGMVVVTSNAVGQKKVAKRSEAEKRAIAAIEKLGGRVKFDEKKPGKPVIGVSFDYMSRPDRVSDAGLVHLLAFRQLQKLHLGSTPNVTGTASSGARSTRSNT